MWRNSLFAGAILRMGPATLSVVYICPTEFYSWNGKVCMALLKALQKRSFCIYHQHQRSWKPLKRSVFMKSALIIRSNLQRNRVKCHGSYKRFQNLRWILKQICLYCSLIGDNKKKKIILSKWFEKKAISLSYAIAQALFEHVRFAS